MLVRPSSVFVLLLGILMGSTEAQSITAAPGAEPWRVVLIRSWDSMYPVNVMREQAMRQAILEGAPRAVEIYPEEMDPLRFPTGLENDFQALLQQKYRSMHVDLVIASGLEPLEFASRYRDDIWPGASIVFNGVIDGTLGSWHRPPHSTGVTMALDVEGTLNLALALAPQARKVYFVSGTAAFDRSYLQLALEAAKRSIYPLEPFVIDDATREQIVDRVAAIEPDALVVYLTMLRDAKGQYSSPVSPLIPLLASRSKAPLFAAVHTQFGRGPVGGSSARFDVHGRAAGRLARTVLEGADAATIPVRTDPMPFCQVDWNALQRWGLSDRKVPGNCEVINRPPAAWKQFFWPLAALLSIILLQAALLGSLMRQSSRRRRAEEQLRERTTEMAHVARIATVGALTASIAHEINQPMGAILSNAEAARMMLDQGTLDDDKLRAILTDIRDEDLRASGVIRGLRSLLGRHEYRAVALELNSEIAEALRHVASEAARRSVRLSPILGAHVPTVMGDAVQIQQVVINLVLNAMEAVSASHQGSEVRIETRDAGNGAEIVVTDRGSGISSENAARLFQSSFTTKQDGMGFGLSIVKTIVEMHGGRISYEPNLPIGAIFRVWLPVIGA